MKEDERRRFARGKVGQKSDLIQWRAVVNYQLPRTRNISRRFDLSCHRIKRWTFSFYHTMEKRERLFGRHIGQNKSSPPTLRIHSRWMKAWLRESRRRFEDCHLPGYLREKRGKWRERRKARKADQIQGEFSLTNTFRRFLFNPWKNSMENGKIVSINLVLTSYVWA